MNAIRYANPHEQIHGPENARSLAAFSAFNCDIDVAFEKGILHVESIILS